MDSIKPKRKHLLIKLPMQSAIPSLNSLLVEYSLTIQVNMICMVRCSFNQQLFPRYDMIDKITLERLIKLSINLHKFELELIKFGIEFPVYIEESWEDLTAIIEIEKRN